MEWIVLSHESGLKLVAFLKNHLDPSYSAKHIKRLIEQNGAKVNGRVERFASTLVGLGDHIFFSIPQSIIPPHFNFEPGRVLYEDDSLLVYNKPAGLRCDPQGIIQVLKPHFPHLTLVHRLDRQTTGVLLLSKDPDMVTLLIEQFQSYEIKKSYQAIVDRVVKKPKGVIENHLGKVRTYEGQSIWGEVAPSMGVYACTEWNCLALGKKASLLGCFPKTGRTHQIRVHLAGIGHPILGDHQYGSQFSCPYEAGRILLHAETIAFHHPFSKKFLSVSEDTTFFLLFFIS